MTRYRWLDTSWSQSISQLALRMKNIGFHNNSSHGFVIDKLRESYIDARYIEKIDFTDTVVDPFGNERFFERVEYRESAFRVSSGVLGLELKNSPRSLQALLSRFSEITDFQASITPINVDVLAWARKLKEVWGQEFVLDSMQISKLKLDSKVSAKVLISGDCDVRESSKLLTESRDYILEKVRLGALGDMRGSIVLSNTGMVTLSSGEISEELLSLLRVSLKASFKAER